MPASAVLSFDLDDFKAVNDRFGHTGGDRLLVEVTARLLACARDGDLVGRFGGDEFLVLTRGAGLAEAAELTACMTDELARPIAIGAETVVIGAAVGAAAGIGGQLTDPDPASAEALAAAAEALIDQADEAMYGAKALTLVRI